MEGETVATRRTKEVQTMTLEATLDSPPVDPDGKIHGVVVGRLIGFDASGRPEVTFQEAPPASGPVPARAAAPLEATDVNRDVAIMCEAGDASRPIIIGVMHHTRPAPTRDDSLATEGSDDVDLDLSARRQITLRCGKASVTLTRAGKIILRGTYVSSRSSGVNKIKGGSVQIN